MLEVIEGIEAIEEMDGMADWNIWKAEDVNNKFNFFFYLLHKNFYRLI